ncbi:hypothetical protein P7C71_g3055, partial [Lecanoromycetidae sp. Uapishka_2]
MFGGNRFNADSDIPDLSGKTILVTGNNGIGEASCRQFAKHNAHVYLAARTPSKAESAIAEIKKETPDANITFLELDLASLASVKRTAETFNASSDRLDVLLNNAGVMALPASTTKDGYEIQFGTNHVGHALFTKLLMPTLQRTAEEKGSDVRIVNKTPQEGALTQLFACTSPEAKSGQYYEPIAKESSGSAYSQDPKLANELWEWTEAELAKHGY